MSTPGDPTEVTFTGEGTPSWLMLPHDLEDADTATLAGRYFHLIEAKEEVEARIGRHPYPLLNQTEVETDPLVREVLKIGLYNIAFELGAIMYALKDSTKHKNGIGALLPDHATDAPEHAELREFEQARADAQYYFLEQAKKP